MIALPTIVAGEPIRVAASTYADYLSCPDSAMARLRGEYGPDSIPSLRGGLAHQIFARHLTMGPIGAADFAAVCKEEIGGSNLNHKLGSLKLKPSVLSGVISEVQDLYDRFRSFPTEGFGDAEVFIEHETDPEVTMVGKVDAYFEDPAGVRLVDWKTGDLVEPLAQLRFYALLWTLDRGEIPACVEAVSVKSGERQREQPTLETVEETAAQVVELINQVRGSWESGSDLPRYGGPGCRYCPMLDRCEEGSAAVSILNGSL